MIKTPLIEMSMSIGFALWCLFILFTKKGEEKTVFTQQ